MSAIQDCVLPDAETNSELAVDSNLWARVLRSGLASVLFFQALRLWPNLADLAGAHAIIPSSIAELADPWWLPRIGWFTPVLARVGLDAQGTEIFCFVLYSLLLLAMLCDILPKATSLLVFVLHVVLLGGVHFSMYGVDQFANIGLFYCIVAPAQVRLREGSDILWRSSLVHRLLQFHLIVVYCTSGIGKAFGPQWWSGEAIWLALAQPISRGMVDMTRWVALLGAAKWVGISVLAIEICYPIFIGSKRTRPVWLVLVVLMHLGIGLFMDMWSFALVMIVLNVSAFGTQYVTWLLRRLPKTSIQP